MTTMTVTTPQPEVDLMFCSPDGESRASIFRVGDVFPLDATGHMRGGIDAGPSQVRPFGMRYAKPVPFTMGAHEGESSTTSSNSDGTGPEESKTD